MYRLGSHAVTIGTGPRVSFNTWDISDHSHLNDNDRSRNALPDKMFVPNHSSNKGMSIGMHAAMMTLIMC